MIRVALNQVVVPVLAGIRRAVGIWAGESGSGRSGRRCGASSSRGT